MDLINPYFLTFLFIILTYKLYKKITLRLPPGPYPWPIVGNLYYMNPLWFRCFTEWRRIYGPIFSVWLGSDLNVVVSSSELAREVLKEKDQELADRHRSRSVDKFSKGGSDLLWADYGPHFVKVRTLCSVELFSPKRLEALRPIREDEVRAMIESIFQDCTNPENKNKVVLLRKYIETTVLNNITRLVFGKRFDEIEGVTEKEGLVFKALVENVLKLETSFSVVQHISWLRWLCPVNDDVVDIDNISRIELIKKIMKNHYVKDQRSGEKVKQYFLDALLNLQEEYELDDDTIIGLLWDMLGMGVNTIVTTLEWGMTELIKNSRILKRAQEELDQAIGSIRVMTEWDFSNLPYLKCIVKEILRLHPSTPLLLPHKASTNVKIGGYDIPKGTNVHINIWCISHDPTIWKNPLEFRPERFMEDDVDMKGHDYRFLPFGAGKRMCPGAQLGINLVTSILGHLLHHFSWAPRHGLEPENIDMIEKSGVIAQMQTPLQTLVTPRLPQHLYKRVNADM